MDNWDYIGNRIVLATILVIGIFIICYVIRIANCQDFCDRAMMTDGDEYNDSLKEHQITNGKVFEKGFIAPELSVIDEIGESRHEILMNSCMNVNCNIGDLHCHS